MIALQTGLPAVTGLAFAPEGGLIAAAGDGGVEFWDPAGRAGPDARAAVRVVVWDVDI